MSATVTSSLDGEFAAVVGSGELDLRMIGQFQKALQEAVDSGKPIVVDFTSASYIDTAVLAALVAAARARNPKLDPDDRRIKIIVADDSHPQYVLKTVGFGGFMDIEIRA